MPNYICVTCGIQYPESTAPPPSCPICEDDRQYVHPQGQQWTTLDRVQQRYRNVFRQLEPGVTAIVNALRDAPSAPGGAADEASWAAKPRFGIGQQAHLIETPNGNILWDCITLLDDETVAEIQQRGGIAALGLSHPHYYTTIAEWSRAFGGIPVYIHAADAPWVIRPDPAIVLWEGETVEILPGCTMIRCGGHFPGAAVLHWDAGADGRGVLFSGDTIQVVADQRWVTFMYSYPNQIPLNAAEVLHIVEAVGPYPFERIYGAFGGIVRTDAHGAVRRSAERYVRHIEP